MSAITLSVPAAAASQSGVFTVAQAQAEGWTLRQVRRRVATGRWQRVVAQGLADHPPPFREAERAWALQLSWPDAVASHRSAAVLHGFPVSPDGRTYLLAGRGHRVPCGVVRHCAPAGDDVSILDGLLVTGRPRTAVDCLATFSRPEALDLFAWLSTRGVLTRAALVAVVRDGYGRAGTPQLVHLLSVTRSGAVSGGELRLHSLLRRGRVTGWVAGARVEDSDGVIGVVDLLFARERVVIEVDGRRAHDQAVAFVNDRRRQNRLVMAGYLVLRFTWNDLVERPDAVISQIRHAVQGAGRDVASRVANR